jgi:hypothetical protein
MLVWHAWEIDIYHTSIQVVKTGEIIEILVRHLRWLANDEGQTDVGRHLLRVGFYDSSKLLSDAFGFLDLACVARGAHLIPASPHRKSKYLLTGSSIAHVHS